MTRKTPEEIEALRAQSQALKAEKDKKRAEKKAKFGDKNADQNRPTLHVNVPWVTTEGREIDLGKPPWDSYVESLRYLWTLDHPGQECRVKVTRT